MFSSFGFHFSGDDVDDGDADMWTAQTEEAESTVSKPQLLEAKSHSLEELISTLPSSISYNILEVPLSQEILPNSLLPNLDKSSQSFDDTTQIVRLLRREVFDIRAQLMAEDGETNVAHRESDRTSTLISGLEQGDINPKVYEGGFKTWECTIDLVKYLTETVVPPLFKPADSSSATSNDLHVIELGAGTALPSLSLLLHFLSHQPPSQPPSPPRRIHLTLCDYNLPVLALTTLPNLLLAWAQSSSLLLSPHSPTSPTDLEFNIEEHTTTSFLHALSRNHITVNFVSGAWSPAFVETLQQGPRHLNASRQTLVLASETIYSPASLASFTSTLHSLLQSPNEATALIAAKRIYFGMGGGVADFVARAEEEGLKVEEKWATDEGDAVWEGGKRAGIERVILEVRKG